MNFSRVSSSCVPPSDPKLNAPHPQQSDPNHNSLFELLDQPPQPPAFELHSSDALSLFDDLDLDKASRDSFGGSSFLVDDLADLIDEKSTTPMLVVNSTSFSSTMMATSPPVLVVNETERRRNEATTLLKSLSVPDPLLGQLVSESLTGFIFVVDAQGRVEFVSNSSTEQVGHSPDHIRGNQIYNFLHPADHSRFGCHLVQQQSPPTSNTDPDKARRNFTCRFKLLNSNESYITLYIACITVRRNQDSVETSRLLCVARKLSDVSPLTMVTTTAPVTGSNPVAPNTTDLFATRLDPGTFKVMLADNSPSATSNSRLKASVAAKTVSMVGKCFLDFCHPDDRDLVRSHFLSTVREKQSVSSVYRMTGLIGNSNGSIHQRLTNVVHVQTKSKYHKTANNGSNSGFIASIHSIVGDVPATTHTTNRLTAVVSQIATSTSSSAYHLTGDSSRAPVVMMSKPSTLSSLLTSSASSTTAALDKTPPSSSPSPTSENSDEAKNQLLKQLLNPNYQPQSSESSSDYSNPRILKLLSGDNMARAGLKRSANSPLDNPPAQKTVSVVCSENPSLTELLEKPPHLSITVPPPVPTKWHQEPREKLPKDIMRKFLPPHPAERAAAAAAAAASATATKNAAPAMAVSAPSSANSALYSVLTGRNPVSTQRSGNGGPYHPIYSSNAANSRTVTSASTSSNLPIYDPSSSLDDSAFSEDKDEMLSEILDGLIEFQEKSPVSISSSSSTSSMAAASRADERRISDIERFLVSSERSLLQQQQILKPKVTSLAASSPSLTSILTAPPLATPTGRPPPQSNGSSVRPTNPVNLVPRMNELLQQVPPNVSIPDTPDLDSLMLLQERRRRMSSGGSVQAVSSASTTTQSQSRGSNAQPGSGSFHTQPPMTSPHNQMGRGQLLMQHLTSSSSGGGNARSTVQATRSYIETSPSGAMYGTGNYTNHIQQQPQQPSQVRRSSFSGLSGANNNSSGPMVSPPSGAVAAAAAAVAAASAVNQLPVQQGRAQRHSSGGTVHHGGPVRGQHQLLGRRLSDSVESTNNSDDKQRSLLQQLLSE